MRIVIDDKIPFIRDAISRITPDAVYLKGSEIGPADVHDADALIVRTRTRCDETLLKGSSVKFVATATIGFDHIDADYMSRAGIEWMSCPGCNASSVEQYLHSVLILLKRQKGMRLESSTIGIVGCGHVGSKVAKMAAGMGMRVLVCDPPRQERGDAGTFVTMKDIEEHHLQNGPAKTGAKQVQCKHQRVANNDPGHQILHLTITIPFCHFSSLRISVTNMIPHKIENCNIF